MDRFLTIDFWRTFWQHAIEEATGRGVRILVVLALYAVGRFLINRVIDAALAGLLSARESRHDVTTDRANRLRTLQGLVKSIVGYVLLFVMIVMLLDAIGANVTGLITTAGVGGLAIGFGAQKLVRDVISGFFIMVEDQFAVGDYVTIGPATGVVDELGMRVTRLRDDQGRLWFLSNGDISTVANHSRAPVESFIEFGVGASVDIDSATEIVNATGDDLFKSADHHLIAAPAVQGVSLFDAAHTVIRVSIVAEPLYLASEQLKLREAVRRRLIEAEIPVA